MRLDRALRDEKASKEPCRHEELLVEPADAQLSTYQKEETSDSRLESSNGHPSLVV